MKSFMACAFFSTPLSRLYRCFQWDGLIRRNLVTLQTKMAQSKTLKIYHVSISKPKRFCAFDHIARTGTNRWGFRVLYWAKISTMLSMHPMIDFHLHLKNKQTYEVVHSVCLFFNPSSTLISLFLMRCLNAKEFGNKTKKFWHTSNKNGTVQNSENISCIKRTRNIKKLSNLTLCWMFFKINLLLVKPLT